MDKTEILEFINKNPIFVLATVEAGRPRARYMMTSIADSRGIIFSTGRKKNVYAQLVAAPAVELCYYEQDSEIQIRIEAGVEEVRDDALKTEIVDKFPFLKPWIEKEGLDQMATFRLVDAKAAVIVSAGPEEKRQTVDL